MGVNMIFLGCLMATIVQQRAAGSAKPYTVSSRGVGRRINSPTAINAKGREAATNEISLTADTNDASDVSIPPNTFKESLLKLRQLTKLTQDVADMQRHLNSVNLLASILVSPIEFLSLQLLKKASQIEYFPINSLFIQYSLSLFQFLKDIIDTVAFSDIISSEQQGLKNNVNTLKSEISKDYPFLQFHDNPPYAEAKRFIKKCPGSSQLSTLECQSIFVSIVDSLNSRVSTMKVDVIKVINQLDKLDSAARNEVDLQITNNFINFLQIYSDAAKSALLLVPIVTIQFCIMVSLPNSPLPMDLDFNSMFSLGSSVASWVILGIISEAVVTKTTTKARKHLKSLE